jgi:RHS repeat-associated protein
MSWKYFLTRLRWFLFGWSRNRRVPRRPEKRRRRLLAIDFMEDRASMEPPMSMLAASAAGVLGGIYAVNLAVANTASVEVPRFQTSAEIAPTAASFIPPSEPDQPGGLAPPRLYGSPEVFTVLATRSEDLGAGWLYGTDLDTTRLVREGNWGGDLTLTPSEEPEFHLPHEPVEEGGGGAESGRASGAGAAGGAGSAAPASSAGASNQPGTPSGNSSLAQPDGAPLFAGGVGLSIPGANLPPRLVGSGGTHPSPRLDPGSGGGTPAGQQAPPQLAQNFANLPVYFEANQGQTDAQVQFLARGSTYTTFLTANGPVLELPRGGPPNPDGTQTVDVVSFQYQGANTAAVANGENQLTGRSNYFSGDSSTIDIPQFASVRYENYYSNIDLVFQPGTTNAGQVEYDYVVSPGGNPSAIQFAVQGAQSVSLDAQGDLVVTTPGGILVDSVPVATETAPGSLTATPVSDNFVLLGGNVVGLQVSGYNSADTLTIDPTLSFSTYLGGRGTDQGNGIAVDAAGNVYLTGSTTSTNFPGTSGSFSGTQDAFVSKLSADGQTLLYSSYLGCSTTTTGQSIAVDAAGDAYVTGQTFSGFRTTTGAYQTAYNGRLNAASAFITKFNTAGDNLVYSTYLDGSGAATGYGIAVDGQGDAYVTGSTAASQMGGASFPTTSGAAQTSYGGGSTNAFVTELNPPGSALVYSTFLGGSGTDQGNGIALDVSGNAYVTGNAGSTNFPTTSGAYQTSKRTGATQNAFVTKVNAGGSAWGYSTYLGGGSTDSGYAIAVNLSGNAYVTGSSTSTNFPTQNAYAASLGGSQDAFVTELNTAGSALSYSTYLGVSGTQTGRGIGVDRSGYATVVGDTNSTSFPTLNATQSSFGGGSNDAFVTSFQPAGNTLSYSSYLGGSSSDQANAVAIDLRGNAYVTGSTSSTNFPTVNPEQGSPGGGSNPDAFVTKVAFKPLPPVFTSISPDTGSSSSDQITTNQNLTISGTAAANSTVTISRADLGVLGTTTANVSGNWSYNYSGTTLPEGTYAFTGTATLNSQTSLPSNPFLVTVDLTAPAVTLIAPTSTTSQDPQVQVNASDLNSLPNGTSVAIDVDKNNDGNFTDAGETGYATGTLTDGHVTLTLPALPGTGTYPMRARITDLAGNQGTSAVVTMTVNTVSNAWTATGQVLTADPLDGQAQEQLGDVQVSHAVDLDQSPGSGQSGDPAFTYNSDQVSVQPIVQVGWQTDSSGALPSSVVATLTWNGAAQASKTFSGGGGADGDVLTIGLQAPTVSTTGRYPWSVALSGGGHSGSVSGVTYVVAEDSSALGAGWTFAGLDQLVSISADANGPAGQLRIYGNGGWRFYSGTSSFTSPAGDPGTLVKNGDNTFTYLLPDGEKWNFNSSGYETSKVAADGLATLSYRYDGSNRLAGTTAIDGALSTFSYGTGVVTLVTANNRVTTLTLSGGNLSSITNPDGGLDTFTYSGKLLQSEAFGLLQNQWAEQSNLLGTFTWGASGSPSVTKVKPVAAVGLYNYNGSTNWGLNTAQASVTDPNSHVTAWQLDSAGRPLQEVAADGGITQWTRDGTTTWVTKVTDPLGRVTTYTRDSSGYVTQETLPDGNTRTYAYQSSFHALTTMTDERNNTSTYGYDANGHQIRATDALGDVSSYSYDAATGELKTSTDPLGHTISYGYDANRRQTTVTDALGNVTSYSYDANGNLLTTTDARGDVTTTTYDVMGRLTQQTDALGDIKTYTYDSSGLQLTSTDALNRQTSTVYDSSNRGLAVDSIEAVGNSAQRSTVESYDNAGQTTNDRNANGYSTGSTFDPLGRVIQTTDALGNVAKTVYDLDGEVVASRDALGNWTKYQYNARGWQTAMTDPLGNTTSYGYDAVGNRTTVTDPLNHVTTHQYDAVNRQTVSTDALGNSVTTQYDAASNVATVTNQRGYKTQYSYDADNRRTLVTEAVGTSVQRLTTTVYDAVGNVTAQTDGINTITYVYDKLNRQIAITDGVGNTTTTAYDAVSNTASMTDALNKTTTYSYNALNQQVAATDALNQVTTSVLDALGNNAASVNGLGKVSQAPVDGLSRGIGDIDALGDVTQRVYDAVGNLVSLTDPVGNQTKFVYDRLNRQILETDPNGSAVTTVYDAAGRMTSRTDQDSRVVTYSYDSANRLTGGTWKNSSGTVVNTLTYSYDAAGNMLTAADKFGTITRSYDALDRLATDQNVFGQVLTYSYDTANRLTLRQDSLGGVLTSVYDADNRLTNRQFGGTSQTPLRVDFAYSSSSELTTITRYSDLAGTQTVGTSVYSFDADGQLTNLKQTNGSGTSLENYTYTYDAANRVLGEQRNGTPDVTYTYDATDQLLGDGTHTYSYDSNGNRTMTGYQTGTGNELTNDGTWTYTYDNAGNLTQKSKGSGLETWYYGYDNANHMTSVRQTSDGTTNQLTVTYTYDVLGNRVQQDKGKTGGSTVTTQFAYDGQNVSADLDGSNNLQVRYLYGNGLDQILARIVSSGEPNAGVAWYLQDRLGSVRDLENGSTQLIGDHLDYDGFGNLSETAATYGDRYKWTGREWDSDVLLRYHRARYASPSLGRWISEDPAGFSAGDSNLYRYVQNDPANLTDPDGLKYVDNGITFVKEANPYYLGRTDCKFWMALPCRTEYIKKLNDEGWHIQINSVFEMRVSAIVFTKKFKRVTPDLNGVMQGYGEIDSPEIEIELVVNHEKTHIAHYQGLV